MNVPGYMVMRPDGVVLALKVQPRAPANEIRDALGSELRVRVTAPPVDAAANEALVRFLAKELEVPRNRVELMRGHTSRHKLVKIHGISVEAILQKLRKNTAPRGKGRG